MANGDYGYFGKGDTGYAQYMLSLIHISEPTRRS